MKERIINAVLTASGLTIEELRERTRVRKVCIPRQMMCYLLYHRTGMSEAHIAPLVGIDRTTVIHSIHKIKANLEVADRLTLTYFRKINEILDDVWVGTNEMSVDFKETLIG
jgi:chromosomal replication initiation ATPase DnaA